MDDTNRFSVMILEKDVLEYNHFKNKFYEYDAKARSCIWRPFRKHHLTLKMHYYDKYIKKMKFLEQNYRKTNIYTKYHEGIEYPYTRIKPVHATPVIPMASAPVLPTIVEKDD